MSTPLCRQIQEFANLNTNYTLSKKELDEINNIFPVEKGIKVKSLMTTFFSGVAQEVGATIARTIKGKYSA